MLPQHVLVIKLTNMIGYLRNGLAVRLLVILAVVAGAVLLISEQGFAQIDGVDPDSALGKQCKGTGDDDPTQCGHGKLLREGTNVYTVYELHAAKKLWLVQCGFGLIPPTSKPACPPSAGDNQAAFNAYKKDGTCLASDLSSNGNDLTKATEACVKRLKRMSADATLDARKEILRNNAGRRELLDDQSGTIIDPNLKSSNGTSPDTVLKDINHAVAIDPKTKIMNLLATPQSVDFGNAEKTLGSGEEITKSKVVKVEDVNTDVANKGSGDNSVNHYEEADETKMDNVLSAAVKSDAKLLKKAITADQKDFGNMSKDAHSHGGTSYNKKDGGTAADSVSAQALQETMKDIAAQDPGNKDPAGKTKPTIATSVLDTKNAIIPISDPGLNGKGKPGDKVQTLNDAVTQDLKDAAATN